MQIDRSNRRLIAIVRRSSGATRLIVQPSVLNISLRLTLSIVIKTSRLIDFRMHNWHYRERVVKHRSEESEGLFKMAVSFEQLPVIFQNLTMILPRFCRDFSMVLPLFSWICDFTV